MKPNEKLREILNIAIAHLVGGARSAEICNGELNPNIIDVRNALDYATDELRAALEKLPC